MGIGGNTDFRDVSSEGVDGGGGGSTYAEAFLRGGGGDVGNWQV